MKTSRSAFWVLFITLAVSTIQSTGQMSRPADRPDNPAAIAKPDASASEIQWLSFEQAVQLNQEELRPFYIDIYTNWCGWCRRMDGTTFKDPKIIQELNQKFWPVRINAEMKDTVYYGDKMFVYKPEYSAHELALSLMNGRAAYPTHVFLDNKMHMQHVQPGYLDGTQLADFLDYFHRELNTSMSFEDYKNSR